ncbi:MAG: hypothetical protein ACE5GW_09780 [Planctomycetota bacterium]
MRALRPAAEEEIATVPGMTRAAARAVRSFLNP